METVDEILAYAAQPAFLLYLAIVTVFSLYMIYKVVPTHGTKNPMVYLSVCSLVGSVSVMAIKVGSAPSLARSHQQIIILRDEDGLELIRIGIRCCSQVDFRGKQPVDTYKHLCLCCRCRRVYLGSDGTSPPAEIPTHPTTSPPRLWLLPRRVQVLRFHVHGHANARATAIKYDFA